ncbi:P-loop containing nucleoside triphosphate hydrolase protein [Phyllosticta capitalensis]|uniref:P-loop containing nucleoside triphosphate hydrolase protein n=1 Tax=Phyllosticta capitalensis TaxID=121624 RepID=UPI00312DFE2B
MAGLPDWFLSKNVRTPKDLENEKSRLSILNPQQKAKKDEDEPDKSPSSELNNGEFECAVSQYLYEEAYDTVASTFVRNAQNRLQAPQGNVVLNCKMDGGMEVSDAFVHHLAKDLGSSLITLEFEDLLDLGWELDHRENRSTGWTLEEKSLKLESPDRKTPLGPAHYYFAVRSHRTASREAWSRCLRAFSSILDCSRVEESSRKAPVMIHVRDAMRVMEESEGSRILARLRDCVEKKQQSGKAITIVATLSHLGTTEDDCDCWICDEKNMYSGYDESSRKSYNRFEKFKRKIGATSASTITVDAPHVSGVKEKGDSVALANLNIRHLKRFLRLRISNCFAVDTLLPDADWMEDFGPESFGESIWTEEEIEKAVARIKGRAWKKPLLDLDDVQVVLKRLGMLPNDDQSSGGEHGGGGHLDKKWKKHLEDIKDTCNDHENELIDGVDTLEELHSKFDDLKKSLGIPDGDKSGGGEHGGDKSSGGEHGGGSHLDKEWKNRLKNTCNKHEIELMNSVVMPEDLHSKFDDVIIDEEVKETIIFLTSMFKFRAETTSHFLLSQIQIKGALLYGPPGTGKTHFSRAIAKESGASMLAIDGAQITSMAVGETEKYIKAAFTLATKLAPCVIFIDEADSLFRRRSSGDKSWERSSITQFLTSMDNIRQKEKGDAPFVLVATNRPMDLDDAFLRRLPQKAMIGLPSKESRSKILRLFVKQDDLDPETDIDSIAEQTDGYSGSDLRSLCAEAAVLWAIEQQQNKDEKEESPVKVKLTNSHFDRALENIRPTVSKQSLRELEEFDRRFNARSRKVRPK